MGMSSRICPQCGNALAPDETKCHICGTQYGELARRATTANLRRTNLQTSTGDQAQQVQYAGFAPAAYGNMPYSSQEPRNAALLSGNIQPVQPTQPAPLPENRNDNASTSSVVPLDDVSAGEKRSLSSMSLPGFIHPVSGRRRPGLLVVTGIVVLLLVLLGGSVYVIGQIKGGVTTVTTHGTTTTTSSTLTPTPSPIPLFTDNFADDSKGWGIGSGRGFSSTIAHNALTLSEENHRVLDIAFPDKNNAPATYSDFSVTATFILSKADQNDSVGLFVRGVSTNGNFSQGYFVDIYGDNSYDVFKVFADTNKDTFLVDPTSSSFINPVGQQNKLTVDMKGPKMVILINDKILTSLSDNDYKSGEVALFVENGKSSNGVQATFTNVVVDPVPNQLPSS